MFETFAQAIQAALKVPLPRGSRVLISSSRAAIAGSPFSGSYAGAKRMIWLMANYANGAASDLDLGIRFQALLVGQIVGSTELGHAAAEAYARKKSVTTEAFLAGFGKPLDPVKAICAALHEAYPYPDDVRIFLREWRPDSRRLRGTPGVTGVRNDFRPAALFGPAGAEDQSRAEETSPRPPCRICRTI
jgi:hypothetical protein